MQKKDGDISALQAKEKHLTVELKAMKEESIRFIKDQVGRKYSLFVIMLLSV